MAKAAALSMITAVGAEFLINDKIKKDDIVLVNDNKAIASITFSDNQTIGFQKTPEGMNSYSNQCEYLNTTAQALTEHSNFDLLLLAVHAAKGVIQLTRDPHSAILTPDELTELKESTRGNFAGLGIEIKGSAQNTVEVIKHLDGSGALAAGIEVGDMITRVGDQETKNISLNEAAILMKGDVGTKINITVDRNGEEHIFEVTRAVVTPEVVTAELRGDIAWMTITRFNSQTADQFEKGLKRLMGEFAGATGNHLEKLVIKLEDNPGGTLNSALKIGDLLINAPKDGSLHRIMSQGRTPEDGVIYYADKITPGNFGDFKEIRIEMNGGSASSAEVLIGMLIDQDDIDANIETVGTRTFGKASVQTIQGVDITGRVMEWNNQIPYGASKSTTALFYGGHKAKTNQGLGINPTTQVITGDFRDSSDYKRMHESDIPKTIMPNAHARSDTKSRETCTLNENLRGEISDERLREIAHNFTLNTLRAQTEQYIIENNKGEAQRFVDDPAYKEKTINDSIGRISEYFAEKVSKNEEYLRLFINDKQLKYFTNQDGNKARKYVSVFNATDLCTSHSIDGFQEITYDNEPVTKIELITPDQ